MSDKKTPQLITETLEELFENHNMTEQKLAHATDVPLRFIVSLKNGEFKKLPARPYIHGYIQKIASAFDVDEKELWESYLAEVEEMRNPHAHDHLPRNRYAYKTPQKGKLVFILIALAIAAFVFFRFNDIIGTPDISLSIPNSTVVMQNDSVLITGSVQPGDELILNTEVIYTDEHGNFEKEIALTPGLNTLEFTVRRFLGRTKTITRQVVYEEPISINNNAEETNEEN
jgi:hypothetical protein